MFLQYRCIFLLGVAKVKLILLLPTELCRIIPRLDVYSVESGDKHELFSYLFFIALLSGYVGLGVFDSLSVDRANIDSC